MNLHVKFVILIVGIVALAGLVMLLRAEAVMPQQSTLKFDVFLALLGAALVGVVISYVRALRSSRAPAVEGDVGEAGPRRGPAMERFLGRQRSRVVDRVVLGVVGTIALFLVVLLGYMLYLHLFLRSG